MMKKIAINVLILGGLIFALSNFMGCTIYKISTPEGFAKKEQPYTHLYLAVSANLSVFTIKSVENWKNGSSEHWFTVANDDFVTNRGYEVLGEPTKITADDGTEGMYNTYQVQVNDEQRNYLVCIFAQPERERFFVLEFQGLPEDFEEESEMVLEAIKTFKGKYGDKLRE